MIENPYQAPKEQAEVKGRDPFTWTVAGLLFGLALNGAGFYVTRSAGHAGIAGFVFGVPAAAIAFTLVLVLLARNLPTRS
ncbi:MAG TPA: hypothetical protein VG826_06110 [Pirellulales bacterium]|nr:hypothetical protein [Pirellulales bacterium]